MRAEILIRQVYEPEGWVHWTSIEIEVQVHYVVQRVPINIVHGEINDFLKGWSHYRIKFYSSFKPMVLFIIGEKIKKIHRRKLEISWIWYGYVFFGLHNVISTHKVSYLFWWNVFCIAQCLKYCMIHTGRLDKGVHW